MWEINVANKKVLYLTNESPVFVPEEINIANNNNIFLHLLGKKYNRKLLLWVLQWRKGSICIYTKKNSLHISITNMCIEFIYEYINRYIFWAEYLFLQKLLWICKSLTIWTNMNLTNKICCLNLNLE